MVEKIHCIVDTDPGVDDSAALALSLYDEKMVIDLITTVSGNLDLQSVTRNALHLLEKFKRTDIPVAMGAVKPMERESKDAKFIHQAEGMGGYHPPKTVKTKPIEKPAVEAMYEVINNHAGDINIIMMGPQTNVAYLIKQHPDVVNKIKHIYCEGCSPYGWKSEKRWIEYISFNASSDPEAFDIVMKSGIPITIVPSRMGRELANFTEQEVYDIGKINDVGRFIFEMYSGYWEPGYQDRRIATNDTCALLNLRYPKLFKTIPVDIEIDTDKMPGKTVMTKNRHSHIKLVTKINRKKMHKLYFEAIKKLDRFKFYRKPAKTK